MRRGRTPPTRSGWPASRRSVGRRRRSRSDINEAAPGGDVGEIGHPSLFGRSAANCLFTLSSGHGVALSLIVVFIRFPRTTPCKPMAFMSRGDRAPSDVEAFARQLPPDLANAIDAEVLRVKTRRMWTNSSPSRFARRAGDPDRLSGGRVRTRLTGRSAEPCTSARPPTRACGLP